MKVAILDDNISFCKSLENYLSKYHFDISIYTNYNDLKNHIDSFELLFLDIEMPNISGIDIAQSLSYKHLDIIFISSHDEMIKKCFNRNVVGFVEKSHLEEIDDIICRIIKKEHLTIIKNLIYILIRLLILNIVYVIPLFISITILKLSFLKNPYLFYQKN